MRRALYVARLRHPLSVAWEYGQHPRDRSPRRRRTGSSSTAATEWDGFHVDFGFAPRDTVPRWGARLRDEFTISTATASSIQVNPACRMWSCSRNAGSRDHRDAHRSLGPLPFDRYVNIFEVRTTVPYYQFRTTPNPARSTSFPSNEYEVTSVRLLP